MSLVIGEERSYCVVYKIQSQCCAQGVCCKIIASMVTALLYILEGGIKEADGVG